MGSFRGDDRIDFPVSSAAAPRSAGWLAGSRCRLRVPRGRVRGAGLWPDVTLWGEMASDPRLVEALRKAFARVQAFVAERATA